MARLIDTSVFIAMERQGIPLSIVAAAMKGEPVGIASISASELLVGVHRADSAERRSRRLAIVDDILRSIPVIAFDLDMARTHARLAVELEAVGHAIGPHDLMIAATAITIGYEVMTRNARHFGRVPGLVLAGPSW